LNSIFAKRMEKLGTETAFEVLAKAKALERQGREIIHLEIGEPDFDTPRNIKDAAIKALNEGYTHYVPSAGILELREAIAEYISESRGIDAKPEEVVVTPGAKPIIFFSILSCVDPGDEVMYPNPGFPIYESVINFVDAKPVPLVLKEENDFRMDPEEVAEKLTDKTKMIILNFPQNPTGSALTRGDVEAIADCIKDRDDIIVVSDEMYCMTGWRLGYGVMREDLAQKIAQLMVNSNSCTCAFIQMAGIEALRGPQDESRRMMAEFKKRRDVIVDGLNSLDGISCKKPPATFYAFPNVKGIDMNCRELSDFLLNKAGVATLPGTSFGEYGDGYLRFSFANSIENLKKAVSRIKEALESR